MAIEVPVGIISSYAAGGAEFSTLQSQTHNGSLTVPCGSLNNYKFQYDSQFVYEKPRCTYLSADELIRKSSTGNLFVTTHVDHKRAYRISAANQSACPDEAPSNLGVTKTDAGFSFANGVCTYSTNSNLLPVGVEGINVEILHAYDTISGKYSGANPKTHVRRKGQTTDYKTFNGKAIKLSVKELLDIAGVDLDKPFDKQPSGYKPPSGLKGAGNSSESFPYPRLTGVRLNMEIKYFNFQLEKAGSSSKIGNADVYSIVELSSTFSWTSRGQDITYRTSPSDWDSPFTANGSLKGGLEDMYAYGINIDITSTGLVAQFNFSFFIQTIIGGLVFLNVAKKVSDVVATKALGVKSTLYEKFMKEEVDLERECARFAIQALVATHFFASKDEDKTGTLDLVEIRQMLRETFRRDPTAAEGDQNDTVMSDHEVDSLALYILRSCDERRKQNRLMGKESASITDLAVSSISLKEFIDIFTEDSVNIETLRSIVQLTDLDEQVASAKYDDDDDDNTV